MAGIAQPADPAAATPSGGGANAAPVLPQAAPAAPAVQATSGADPASAAASPLLLTPSLTPSRSSAAGGGNCSLVSKAAMFHRLE